MIERIIDYSIRNPLVVMICAGGLVLWGIYSTIHTPVDAIPDLSENQVIVFADWPGRSPQEVEDQVTYPLSVNLQGLAGVKTIRSTSDFGFSLLNIIFDENVDFYFARQRILERLPIASTSLPAGVEPYLAPDATAVGQVFWYTVEGDGYDVGRLRAIQDWFVRYQLQSVPGVAEVASVGGFPIEYQVDVDPDKLRSFNVTLGDLYSAVARSNLSVGGRVIQKGNSEYLVRSIGWIKSLADVEQTVIRSVNGTPVCVGDVAAVQFGSTERRNVLEKNGNEAVGGVVLMRFGENPRQVIQAVKSKIQKLQLGLPPGVHIVPFYDRTQLIDRAIHTVTGTLIEEGAVASVVIFLVMWHLRSALIICLMLPLSVLFSFILMRQLGVSSNIMSLSGIAISIGVLVDAGIVMVDQAAHTLHGRFGEQPVRGDTRDLLSPALRTVGRPIFFSLAIMIISFIPVFALTGIAGKMFRPLAFTKSFALLGVAILAVTLAPAVIPFLMRGRIRHENESWLVRRVIEVYRPILNYLMDHPWPLVWMVSAICIVGAIPIGLDWLFRVALMLGLGLCAWATWPKRASSRAGWALSVVTMIGSLVVVGLTARQSIAPLGREFMPTLDEGSILDMPVTIPRFGHRVGGRSEGPRRGNPSVSRSRNGRGKGRAGGNAHRPRSAGYDRDGDQLAAPRALGETRIAIQRRPPSITPSLRSANRRRLCQ